MFGRAQVATGVAMLGGSVLGGVVAQLTDLGMPYLLRAGLLLVTAFVAWRWMHDLGFSPDRTARPLKAVRAVLAGAVDGGLRNRPVRWLMIAAPFTAGTGIYIFYALQPYLLQLWGDPNAYSIAGLAAALVAGVAGDRRPAGGPGASPVPAPHRRTPARRRASASACWWRSGWPEASGSPSRSLRCGRC